MKRREKMKRIALLCLLVGFIVSSAYGSITAVQSGDWSDPNTWNGTDPFADYSQEVKISGADDITVTVSTDLGGPYTSKVGTCRGNTLAVVSGGSASFNDDIKIGDAGASSSGTDVGYLTMTGGYLSSGDRLDVGYGHTSGTVGEMLGYATISGGTVDIGSGGIRVGADNADGSTGYLTIIGNTTTISTTGRLMLGNNSTSASDDAGVGNLEFELSGDGYVSRIVCTYAVINPFDGEEGAAAHLVITVPELGTVNAADIVLVEGNSTSSVVGVFDTISNGTTTTTANEGQYIQLGSEWFKLTYQADLNDDDGNNDIVLINVPEPATLLLLAIGGLIATKRRK
jgi:hypothetical protein